ncbi:hypothetical protein BCV70DRAFT_86349 [Testicularia cyperi]|uniref:Secreted protein n=1 Tax=Testicularia cyperi TaxID=1882483 RepID=A0A317XRI9_9BASI|nr:hypothetical protein BCV70DRAFT_86349 [Testicularia cyperi]
MIAAGPSRPVLTAAWMYRLALSTPLLGMCYRKSVRPMPGKMFKRAEIGNTEESIGIQMRRERSTKT